MNMKKIGVLLMSLVMMMSFGVYADECIGGSCSVDVTLNIIDDTPDIISVESGVNVVLTEKSTTNQSIYFIVADDNGWEDINESVTALNVTKDAVTHEAHSCVASEETSNQARITCEVEFDFYDVAGNDWEISAYAEDNAGNIATHTTQVFTVAQTSFVEQDVTGMTWGSVSAGVDDVQSDTPIVLTNGGNVAFTSGTITGYDVDGTGSALGNSVLASSFEISNLSGSANSGVSLSNGLGVDVSSVIDIPVGAVSTQSLYSYVDMPSVPSGVYQSTSSWVISLS